MEKLTFEDVFGKPVSLYDLPPGDEFYRKGVLMEERFTKWVDCLRDPSITPCEPVNDIMTLLWRLVGNGIVPVALGGIKTLGLAIHAEGGPGKEPQATAMIMCPADWYDMTVAEPYMQMGAMVYTASRARDYWNFKIPESGDEGYFESHCRGMMFEAEFLFDCERRFRDFEPNEYQKQVMGGYPEGVKAGSSIMYESMPYLDPDTAYIALLDSAKSSIVKLRQRNPYWKRKKS